MGKKEPTELQKVQRMRALGKAKLITFSLKPYYLSEEEIPFARDLKYTMNMMVRAWDKETKRILTKLKNDNIST